MWLIASQQAIEQGLLQRWVGYSIFIIYIKCSKGMYISLKCYFETIETESVKIVILEICNPLKSHTTEIHSTGKSQLPVPHLPLKTR